MFYGLYLFCKEWEVNGFKSYLFLSVLQRIRRKCFMGYICFADEKFKRTHHSNLAAHSTSIAPVYDLCEQMQIFYRNQIKYLESKLCLKIRLDLYPFPTVSRQYFSELLSWGSLDWRQPSLKYLWTNKDDLCEIFVICETPSNLDWLWKFVAARFRQHIGGLWMGSLNDVN